MSKRFWLAPTVKGTAIPQGIQRFGDMCQMGALSSWFLKQLTKIRFASSRLMKCLNPRQNEKGRRSDMVKNTFKRTYRSGKLSAQQAARDEEIRHKVQAEFPPLETESVASVLSDPLRKAIASSPRTV